jgi:thiamine biosynthesis lipoprotein
MGTIVTIDSVSHPSPLVTSDERDACLDRAFGWFSEIERLCTRFDPGSELMQLGRTANEPTEVSPLLFEALRFAMAVADDTDGAFDPTVGQRMERAGFNREHRTGELITTALTSGEPPSYRDVSLDDARRLVTVRRPLVFDLGAVAKGLALDMAARELESLEDFVINAGGDLYLSGLNADGAPWSVGIRHPTLDDQYLDTIHVSGQAVCTSGNYERHSHSAPGAGHLLNPRNGRSADGLVSATVVAPIAMLADALATAAFVLGPVQGLNLLERHGVSGALFTPDLRRIATAATSAMDSDDDDRCDGSGTH